MKSASIIAYLLSAIALFLLLPEAVCFDEQWHTFYWDSHWCSEVRAEQGVWHLISLFVTQFMAERWMAALIYALPTALGALLLVRPIRLIIEKIKKQAAGWCTALLPVLLATVIAVVACVYALSDPDGSQQRFKSQMCLVEDEEWSTIIAQSEGRKVTNYLEQNILNLALAETGQLQKRVKQQPCRDINSLVVMQIGSPYVAAMISDIYWCMGEISISQMYAFEANEKVGNLSPRLLKRLVLTNIVYGHYQVAEKYLKWLDKTIFYREWAAYYRTKLSDEAVEADAMLSLKRRCIPAENGFPSAQSMVYDLQQILIANPQHTASAEYLGAINRLYGGF